MNIDTIIALAVLAVAVIGMILYYKHLTNKDTVSHFMGKTIWPKRIKDIFKPTSLLVYHREMDVDTDQLIRYFNGTVKRSLKSKKLIIDLGNLGMFGLSKLKDYTADVELNLDLERACAIVNNISNSDCGEQVRMLQEINNRLSKEHATRTLTRLERTYILAALFKRKIDDNGDPKRNPMLANRFLRRAKVLFVEQGKFAELDQIVTKAYTDYVIRDYLVNLFVFDGTFETYPNENSKMFDYQLAVIFGDWL